MVIRRHVVTACAACAWICAPFGAAAQTPYPTKPIRWIVPFPAGGPSDVLARAIAPRLIESLGQPVAIDNRGGAGGNIGSDLAAKAPPDGHTLLMAYVGPIAINVSLYGRLPYHPVNDFAPITLVASSTLMLVAHPSTRLQTVQELVSRAKGGRTQFEFASPGSGTPPHLAGELLNSMTGIRMVHVPYKGAAPALTDVLGGQVPLAIVALPAAMPHVKAGKLRALGVTSPERSVFAPDVPAIAEADLAGYAVENWQGVLAPAGTPRAIVDRLNAEIVKVLAAPDVKDRLHAQGFEIVTSTPEQFGTYIRTEIVKWAKVVKASGAKVD